MNSLVETTDNRTITGQFDPLAWFAHERAEFPGEAPIDYYRLDSEFVEDFHQISVADGTLEISPVDAPSRGTYTLLELVQYAEELQRVIRAAIHLNVAQAVTA